MIADQPKVWERAQGRWRGVLAALGMDAKALTGRQVPCPVCGGKDRFRFDDKDGRGTFFCNRCGSGDGVKLVQMWKGVGFKAAAQMIEEHVGRAAIVAPRAERDPEDLKSLNAALWSRARPLDGGDIVSRYLKSRGVIFPSAPLFLRWIDALTFKDGDGPSRLLPAMLAKFVAPDDKGAILHRTWIVEPALPGGAFGKFRKMMPGKVPDGGAVRLGDAAEEMGVAEGIETAASAARLWGIPVWAATSANALIKWRPPEIAKRIVVFGDADASYTGQMAAYSLAYRLKTEQLKRGGNRFDRVSAKFPNHYDEGESLDWNEVLQDQLREAA